MTITAIKNPWLEHFRPNPQAGLRLFCFPYAGGSGYIFRSWSEALSPWVEVCPVQLPGRGRRLREPAYTRLGALVEAAHEALSPLDDKPFAFFGHSMGALLAFELARAARRRGTAQPAHLFVSGRRAPDLAEPTNITYGMPEPQFIEALGRMNGTPKEVLAHPELMQLLIPVLRTDFEVCQTYEYAAEAPLDCPVTALGGLHDEEVSREQLEGWRDQTSGRFTVRMLPGDHFFLHTAEPAFLKIVLQELRPALEV